MKLVYICSPLRGNMKENIEKATEYCASAARRGVIPLAPHTIFTQYLDDHVPTDRQKGLDMGLALLKRCDELWVCGGQISQGMQNEISAAQDQQIPIRYFMDRDLQQEQRPPDDIQRRIQDIQETCGQIFLVRTEGYGVTDVILPTEASDKYSSEDLKEVQDFIPQVANSDDPSPEQEQQDDLQMEP